MRINRCKTSTEKTKTSISLYHSLNERVFCPDRLNSQQTEIKSGIFA